MYAIRYFTTKEDLLALSRCYLRRRWKLLAFWAFGYFLGPAMMSYMLLRLTGEEVVPASTMAMILGITCAGLWLAFVRSAVRRGVAKQLDDPNMKLEHEFLIRPEGICERTSVNDSSHAWRGLLAVEITAEHVVFYLSEAVAHVVPRRCLPEDAIGFIRERVPTGKLLKSGP